MEELAKDPRLPFDKAWIQQGVDWQRYRTIYVAPVNTDYLRQANWWQEGIRADQMEQDVQNLASFMRTQFIRAFQDDPRRRFRVVMAPEKGSLTLATALTELVPNKVALNAMRSAAPFVAPIGAGLAVSAFERGTGAQSTVAFEAKVKDSNSGRISGHVRRPNLCHLYDPSISGALPGMATPKRLSGNGPHSSCRWPTSGPGRSSGRLVHFLCCRGKQGGEEITAAQPKLTAVFIVPVIVFAKYQQSI